MVTVVRMIDVDAEEWEFRQGGPFIVSSPDLEAKGGFAAKLRFTRDTSHAKRTLYLLII